MSANELLWLIVIANVVFTAINTWSINKIFNSLRDVWTALIKDVEEKIKSRTKGRA